MHDYSQYDVVLLPTFIQVEAFRKRRALAGESGLFAQTATTFNAWIADLWELYGDGRSLVDSVERATLMRIAFSQLAVPVRPMDEVVPDFVPVAERIPAGEQDGFDALTLSPGIARLAAHCEAQAAGVAEFDAAVETAAAGGVPEGLSVRETLFLRGIARYRELLGGFGQIELGEACKILAENAAEVFPRSLRVLLEDASPLDWRMSRFFSACPMLELAVNMAPGAEGIQLPQTGARLRVALPAGRYATPALLMQILRELLPGERAVICCANPLALYRQLEPALADAGLTGGVQAQIAFGETDFGRAFLLALDVANNATLEPSELADVLRMPYAGFTPSRAREYDVRLRADRIAERDTCIAELCAESEDFAALMTLVKPGTSGFDLTRFERLVDGQQHRSLEWHGQERGAINCLRSVQRYAAALGAGWRDYAEVLEQMGVTVSAIGVAQNGEPRPDVLITTQGAAAQLDAGSYALLIAADLTAEAYPLSEKDDAATTLFAKLWLEPTDDVLSRSRRTFTALLQVPTREFICMRPQNDVDGNPAYACAMFEELLDAYRAAEGQARDAEGDADELPASLAATLIQRGEDALFANSQAAVLDVKQEVAVQVETPVTGVFHTLVPADGMLPPRRGHDGTDVLRKSPSPSQVEAYLECPYKWFVERRLNITGLNEDFDAFGRGTFAHEVLERFYRAFIAAGFRKVSDENIGKAREMLRDIGGVVRAEMRTRKPGDHRWVASNTLEEREISQMIERLVEYLDYEKQILPGFHPAYLEYEFKEGATAYAGCPMVGTVDRVDVDDAGHAVIFDYKGSAKTAQDIAGKNVANPGKVQTRIYAQMVKRELGLEVVGAFYVSYGKAHKMAGAADARVLEAAHLPGAKADGIWCALADPPGGVEAAESFDQLTFATMLDETERVVAQAVERMDAGDIAPNPAAPEVCEYCSVAACPRRAKKGK